MVKQKEIKIKYPEARVRANQLKSWQKKNTTIESRNYGKLESNLIKKHVQNQKSENSLKN